MAEKIFQFSETMKASKRGGVYVDVPFDVEKEFQKKRVKIVATFDGIEYRGSLVKYGSPNYFLLVRKDIRALIKKDVGDIVAVTVKEDTAPRVVTVPTDFELILNENPAQFEFFKKLSYTHQKEYVNWITSAKRSETRLRRMNKAIEMMKKGQKGI